MKSWIRSLKSAESAHGTVPEPRPLLSQHPQTTPESLPTRKTLEQRAHVTGYLAILHVWSRSVCTSLAAAFTAAGYPIPGEQPGQVGTPKAAPTSSPGSSSPNEDGIQRGRPGGGQEHPATLERSGTMSRLSAPARAGSRFPENREMAKG